MLDDTFNNLDKLLGKLASAATAADIPAADGLKAAMFEIEEFVLGAVAVERKHGAELQKKTTPRRTTTDRRPPSTSSTPTSF